MSEQAGDARRHVTPDLFVVKGVPVADPPRCHPLVEQRYLVDSDAYMRFVCHAMVRRLMEVERNRLIDR